MKKFILLTVLISFFLVSTLTAQGKPIQRLDPVPAPGKVHVWGSVSYTEDLTNKNFYVFALIKLKHSGLPITGAIVRIQETVLADQGDGSYQGNIWHHKCGLGKTLTLSADFSRVPPLSAASFPYVGRVKVAEFTIANTVEWIFPIDGQTIDITAYPSGLLARWNFTGTPGSDPHLLLKCEHVRVFAKNTPGEELTIPAGIMQPGKLYLFQLIDEPHFFTMSSAFDPSSSVRFGLNNMIRATTQRAK